MGHHQLASLIKMANQIAANNAHIGDDAELTTMVANHLRKFWARPLKQQISEHLSQGGEGLSPVAKRAIKEL